MSPEPDPGYDIDGDVYVSPRYLAGTTGIGDPALQPLLALGWDLQHDDLGNAYVHAPDRRVRLGYLPEGEDDGLWRINAYKDPFAAPAWGVCFNDSTPTEFVQAFTTALAAAYEQGPDAYLARPVADSAEHDPFFAVVPLLKRDWEMERPRWGAFVIQSPDGLAGLEFTTGDLDPEAELTTREARWQLWAGTSIDRPAWYVTASTDTPVALLTAVTQCVSDPAPLPRWGEDTYSYVRGMAQLTPILPPGPPAPTPLDVRRAAASRRPAALPAPRSQRPALEHHQPASPTRPVSIAPARSRSESNLCPCRPPRSSPSCASPFTTAPSSAPRTSPSRSRTHRCGCGSPSLELFARTPTADCVWRSSTRTGVRSTRWPSASWTTAPSTAATKPTTLLRTAVDTAHSTPTTARAVRHGRAPLPPGWPTPSSSTPKSGSQAPGELPRHSVSPAVLRAEPPARFPPRRPLTAVAVPAEPRQRSAAHPLPGPPLVARRCFSCGPAWAGPDVPLTLHL